MGVSPPDGILDASCRLAAGSTRFCAGILSTARHLTIEQKMADYSNKLYHQLEQETGIQTGKQVIRRSPVSLWRGLRGSVPSVPGGASARGFGGQGLSPRPGAAARRARFLARVCQRVALCPVSLPAGRGDPSLPQILSRACHPQDVKGSLGHLL